ncbi:hypothetical protein HYDPIDRAFT_104771 [Hydnomerulius pinastri MD-312]|nr:hypothetical protein HYDPIDRAFT_104771 [Hydnomerulius pinastri MD-312]
MHLFTPNHVLLIAACYPPSSALLSAGPEYHPNGQELSRLTYYAANRPGKIHKVGSEIEKRAKTECAKAHAGNPRARVSLLITLAVLRALAIECRRDISLLSPSLVSCLRSTLDSVSSDLEICARAASVFTAWCTYTDGHVIGVDADLTQNYLVVLGHFATQSTAEIKSIDHELRNRTRLVGLASISGVVNSEALYSSSTQFKPQVSQITRALLFHMIQADSKMLEECGQAMKESPSSVYLGEFRTRPPLERRAASIHAHIDGETGPSSADVLTASLRALSYLLQHSNAAQVGFLLQAAFETLDEQQLWGKTDQCRWFAQKACEWTQYQYRYAVPSRLVERLLATQDTPVSTSQQKTLTAMLTTVFTSPIPLVNLSTSDIVSNLITLVLRRTAANPDDDLLPLLVESIASLGTHIYYSDQIQDLASELISRLITIEMQGPPSQDKDGYIRRSQAIRCLLAGLLGLMLAADTAHKDDAGKNGVAPGAALAPAPASLLSNGASSSSPPTQVSSRTRVSGEVWHETLSLICDGDYAVRSDYAHTLVTYLRREIPKRGDITDADGVRRPRPMAEGSPSLQANSISLLLFGDSATRSLHAIHAYLFMLATSSSFGATISPSPSPAYSLNGELAAMGIVSTATAAEAGNPQHKESTEAGPSRPASSRRSAGPVARSRKASNTQRLLDCVSEKVSASCPASLSDHALILHVLTAIHEEVPVRGLLTGIPMLLRLDGAAQVEDGTDLAAQQRARVLKEVIARVWLVIGRVWDCSELITQAETALATFNGAVALPRIAPFTPGVFRPAEEQILFPPVTEDETLGQWSCVNTEMAISVLVSSKNVQEATGLDRQGLMRRFTAKWSAEAALRDSIERSNPNRPITESGSPLLKLSPALMAIENLSLQSLTRSVRGVGVMDLREALEGRAGASSSALVRPPSVSTLDHSPSFDLHSTRLALTRTKSRPKKRAVTAGSGEVRDVLNRLGIGKANGNNLLKASFPSLPKSDHRSNLAVS